MSTAGLLILDLVVIVMATASWTSAGIIAWRLVDNRSPRGVTTALVLSGCGMGLTVLHLVLAAALAGRGWWFAQDQALIGAPVLGLASLVATVGCTGALLRGRLTGAVPRRVPVLLLAAGVAGSVALIARIGIGYPVTPAAGGVVVVLAGLVIGLIAAIRIRATRRVVGAWAGIVVITLVTSLGLSYLTSATNVSDLHGGHAHTSPEAARADAPGLVPVTDLRTTAAPGAPVRSFTLTAGVASVALTSGTRVDAWTYNGSLPGPQLRVTEGDVVDVTLINRDIEEGVTIHWHGVDLPNGDDGVAGVTQDAVLPGETFRYRFAAEDAGTYWYHTHQASSDGVARGLYGTLVVEPSAGVAEELDLVLAMHTFDDISVFGREDRPYAERVVPGTTVRVRTVNTDRDSLTLQLHGTPFRIVAVDGRELVGGADVDGRAVRLPAGGRVDLAFTMPDRAVTLMRDGDTRVSLTLSPNGDVSTPPEGGQEQLDLLAYDSTSTVAIPEPVRRTSAVMVLDRLPRVLGGLPGWGHTVNGAVAPQIPAIVVEQGDLLRLTVVNRGSVTHPMHIHGHHVRVVSRDGIPTRAALWVDTFDVQPGEVWVVELYADNPGVWMDHCHNLEHAAAGMLMALTYRGVQSPFELGGDAANRPE